MDSNFIERQSYQVKKENYELIYSDKMLYGGTRDSLYAWEVDYEKIFSTLT